VSIGALALIVLLLVKAAGKDARESDQAHLALRMTMTILGYTLFVWGALHGISLLQQGEHLGWLFFALLPSLALLLLLLAWPTAVIEKILVPKGLVRATYYTALVLLWHVPDRRGQALLLAHRALLHAPPLCNTDEDEAFLAKRLALVSQGAAALLAAAMQLARTQGLAQAVPLLRCVDTLDPKLQNPWAMETAHELLVVEAISRGDWPKAASHKAGVFSSPLTHFLGDCARVFVSKPDGAQAANLADRIDWRTHWQRLSAEQRQHLQWLLARAQNHRPQKTGSSELNMSERPRIELALAALTRLWLAPPHATDPSRLRAVGETWDQALSDKALQQKLLTRALALGIPGAEQKAKDTLRAQVVATLRGYLAQGAVSMEKLFPDGKMPAKSVLLEASLAVRAEFLEKFEALTGKLEERTLDKRALPWLDEWREWAQVRDAYQRIDDFGGLEARRLAWTSLHRQANNWACWLWNERSEKVLANAVFRFLEREAEALGDDRSLQLARKNVGSGL